MKSIFITVALYLSTTVNADCFGGSNKRPDHGIEFVEFAAGAGYEVDGVWSPGSTHLKTGKTSDGVCLNLKLENQSSQTMLMTVEKAMDAWIREWVGCEHGGSTKYGDGWRYTLVSQLRLLLSSGPL